MISWPRLISSGPCLIMAIHTHIKHEPISKHDKELHDIIDGAKPFKWMKMSTPCGRPWCAPSVYDEAACIL